MSAYPSILLQKSKVAAPQIFRENKKRGTIADSYNINRVAEAAGEFDAKGSVPSRLYTKGAPIARRIFDHQCKKTFAQALINQLARGRMIVVRDAVCVDTAGRAS
jgi:hypothetical protein